MGTSADLAIRYKGRTTFLHASNDAHLKDVLAQVTATLAAAGPDAIRQCLDRLEPQAPQDDEFFTDRRAMGNAYIEACQSRDQSPILLEEALGYEYGDPDFSHGGLICLFAPAVMWNDGFCNTIEDAGFILDLDRGVLVVPDWNQSLNPGDYDNGLMPELWRWNVVDLEGLDPEQLHLGFMDADLDSDQSLEERQAAVETVLASVRAGQFTAQAPWEPSDHYDDGPAEPSIHTLLGGNHHTMVLQAVTVVLQGMKDEFPVLSEPGTLLFAIPEEGQFQLLVDLRRNTDSRVASLVENLFQALASKLGMVSSSFGPYTSSRMFRGGGFASATAGGKSEDQSAWDADFFPANHWPLKTEQERLDFIEKMKTDRNVEDLAYLRLLGVTALDTQRWQSADDSGQLVPLFPKELKIMAPYALELFSCVEAVRPGSTAERFQALSEGQRSAFLEGLTPVDRFVLKGLVKDIEPTQKSSRRGPRP